MIRIVVPCTSGNVGSGFDALGVALDARTIVVEVEPDDGPLTIGDITGEGARELPSDSTNRVVVAAEKAAQSVGLGLASLNARIAIRSDVPLARGLGSSAAAAVAGAMLADVLLNGAVGKDRVLAIAAELEGHCDNVAPAVYGGFQVSLRTGDRYLSVGIPVRAPLAAALFIPDERLTTKRAREVLPREVPMSDAVFNLGRSALTVAALTSGRFELLGEGLGDRLHQPARTKLMPWLPQLIEAALAAGAYGAALSGAGTTVCALVAPKRAGSVAGEMRERARSLGVPGVATTSNIHTAGATVTR